MIEQRRQRKRVLAIVLGLIASAALAVAAFTDFWLSSPDFTEDVHFGLRSFAECHQTCVTGTAADAVDKLERELPLVKKYNEDKAPPVQMDVPHPPWHGFSVVGWIATIAALVAAAGLLVGVGLALATQRIAWPLMPTTIAVIALAIAIVTGCIFIATKPDVLDHEVFRSGMWAPKRVAFEEVGVGWSFILFGIGAVAGLAAVFPLNRQIRPIDAELGAAASTMSWGGSRDDQ